MSTTQPRQRPRSARMNIGDQVDDGAGCTGIIVARGPSYVGFRPLGTASKPSTVHVRPISRVRRVA